MWLSETWTVKLLGNNYLNLGCIRPCILMHHNGYVTTTCICMYMYVHTYVNVQVHICTCTNVVKSSYAYLTSNQKVLGSAGSSFFRIFNNDLALKLVDIHVQCFHHLGMLITLHA